MIATYYAPVALMEAADQLEMLGVFSSGWRGADVCCLNDAMRHPRFRELEALLADYPEITPPGYRAQCFYRWLAYAVRYETGPLLLVDYDVLPWNHHPMEWFAEQYMQPTCLDGLNPCLVFLPDAGFLATVVDMLFKFTVPAIECGLPHIGDNTVFERHWEAIGGGVARLVTEYPNRRGRFVHFANRHVPHNKAAIMRAMLFEQWVVNSPAG